jgi:DNA (cytosine-5)-methyltransferase 1
MCGGGGSTTGIWRFIQRTGLAVARFVAINHDCDAITWHTANHPLVTHYCQDFESVDLREAFPDGYCDFAWGSTSCTQHSRARGGRPINDQLREGPWHLLHFVSEVHVARMAIENVPEFLDWAPLGADGRPLASRKGDTFRAWRAAMEAVGYTTDWRIDNAADYGGGTTRERFIMLLTRRGRIVWAVPTHSRDGHGDLFSGQRERWRGAREFLDFTIPSKPIVGRRIPLAAPTLARAWHGIRTFWGVSASRAFSPDIRDAALEGLAYVRARLAVAQDPPLRRKERPVRGGGLRKSPHKRRSLASLRKEREGRIKRLQTAVTRYEELLAKVQAFLAEAAGSDGAALRPFVVNLRGTDAGAIARSVTTDDQPVQGITTGSHIGVVSPAIGALEAASGQFVVLPAAAAIESLVGGNRANNLPKPGTEPMAAITTGGGLFVVDGELETLHLGQHGGGVARPESEPFSTLTQGCAASMVEPVVTAFYGAKDGRPRASRSLDEPLASQTTENRFGPVEPLVTSYERETDGIPSRARPVSEPVKGILTRDRLGLVEPVIVPASSDDPAKQLDDQLGSPTTTQRGRRLIEPVLVQVTHGDDRHAPAARTSSLNESLRGLTRSNEHGLVEPYLVTTNHAEENAGQRVQTIDEALPPRTTRNGEAVVEPFLAAHFGEREGQAPRVHATTEPFPSVTHRGAGDLVQAALERVEAIDPALRERLLIGEDGRVYVAHLHFRMLHPRKELAPAMGFPRTYRWPESNTIVTKLVGNAVHVDWADAIVSAFLSDLVPVSSSGEEVA